jgi:hypothetical protein
MSTNWSHVIKYLKEFITRRANVAKVRHIKYLLVLLVRLGVGVGVGYGN